MYLIKKNNVITLTRGDYLKIPVVITRGRFPYDTEWTLEEGDYAFFGLMEPNKFFDEAILKKELTSEDLDSEGNLYVEILPEDTMNLCPGVYYYEIKVLYKEFENSEDYKTHIDTIVQKTKFILVD